MNGTLLTIVILLVLATVLAIIQARRRDRCLKGFDQFHATLTEKGGDLTWGALSVYPSGLEVVYTEPVVAPSGHLERSFLFFKDQYETMDALYRYPEALPAEEQERRAEVIARTVQPGFGRRLWRKLRTWFSMVRDALVQSVGLVLGLAKTTRPGGAVLASQEQQLKAISGEVIGHAGNAFDPLLEAHLFRQVVLEVTRGGVTRSYCGWLKDYTSQFIEVVDAYANAAGSHFPTEVCAAGTTRADGLRLQAGNGLLTVYNDGERLLHIEHVEAGGWRRGLGCVLPPGYAADLPLPPEADAAAACARVGTVERIDLVVPRAHALVRHAADGSEARRAAAGPTSVMAELKASSDGRETPGKQIEQGQSGAESSERESGETQNNGVKTEAGRSKKADQPAQPLG